jgi:hypothetical protein
VTDFSAPNAAPSTADLGIDFVDPHIVHTAYDFSWPNGGNLSSVTNQSTDPFCITVGWYTGYKAYVSNSYGEVDAGSADCVPALGAACVNAILSAPREPPENGCKPPTELNAWWNLVECATTLLGKDYHRLSTDDLNNQSLVDSGEVYPRESGQPIWGDMSKAFEGSNTTAYLHQANRLQVMLFDPAFSTGDETWRGPQLLCTRVVTSELSTDEGAGQSGEPSLRYFSIYPWEAAMWSIITLAFILR